MPPQTALVLTTINAPTTSVEALSEGARAAGWDFFIAGDRKTPNTAFAGDDRWTFLSYEQQISGGTALSRTLPARTYARKMFGYLEAFRSHCAVLVETDDDNAPLPSFFISRADAAFCGASDEGVATFFDAGWLNVYHHFAPAENLWPRGFPLSQIGRPLPLHAPNQPIQALVFQGLANGEPDVDAVHRLVFPQSEYAFPPALPVQTQGFSWCPFNSQNTTWWREAFLLLYLPFTCSFRMTDIYRSFIAQRILAEEGSGIVFHGATVHQDRNVHSIIDDFRDENVCYIDDGAFMERLQALDLRDLSRAERLRKCYACAVEHKYVQPEELTTLEAWVADCATLGVS